jgi:hypothetical protein
MLWIFCTKAKVYEVHSAPRGPIDCAHQRLYVRCQRLVKYFHREYFGIGRLFANYCRYCGPMAEAIHIVGFFRSVWMDRHAASDSIYVRMRGMHAAIDHRDPERRFHRAAAATPNSLLKLPWRSCNSSGVPLSTIIAPSSTITLSA